jgi:hypothetical protein
MSGLIFDEQSMIDNNIFKYEQRLKSHTNKYIENGALLTTFFNIRDNATTVDRGLRDIDKIFGLKSPLRFNKILNFPVYGFGQANPNNTDEAGIEDINIEGECIIQPSTIVPSPNDFFIINHLKMRGIFQVTDVQYDSMKQEGYYKIKYRLHSTSFEILQNLEKQTVETYHCDLNAIGSNISPIMKKDDFVKKGQIEQMVNQMISSYRSMFYNERHNCFLFYNQETGTRWFDMCGNEFMAKHSIMNSDSNKVIILHEKIIDRQFALFYNNSIYNWIEIDCPIRFLRKFNFILTDAEGYPDSSFARWSEGDIEVIQPLALHQSKINYQKLGFFDANQIKGFEGSDEPNSEYEKLIYKFINNSQSISIDDISLYTADALLSSVKHLDIYLYTPMIIYIIRKILSMN